jgi:Fe2+ transport system protein FeoA
MLSNQRVVVRRLCGEDMPVNMSWTPPPASPETEARCELCPLNRVQAGMAVRIRQLCATPEVQNRLREIGLGEDQIVRLVTSQANFICQVCNARLAISEQLARLILVEPLLKPSPAPVG